MSSSQSISIVITGPDGAGKSTVCSWVYRRLEEKYGSESVALVSVWDAIGTSGLFPSREAITQYLSLLEGSARTLFIFHAMAQSVNQALRKKPIFLLIDSFFYKYAASEISYGVPEEVVLGLSRGFLVPDAVFLLGVDASEAVRRKKELTRYESGGAYASGADQSQPQQEKFLLFQNRMKRGWEIMEAQFGPWNHIHPTFDPERVADRIFTECLRLREDHA